MPTLPAASLELFEKPSFGHLAVVLEDGRPHVTPVWIGYDTDRDRLLVNSKRGRRKVAAVEADPRVSVSVVDADDPYCRLTVLGTVTEVTEEGAAEDIDALARRYTGSSYSRHGDRSRVSIWIRPDEGVYQFFPGDREEVAIRTQRFEHGD